MLALCSSTGVVPTILTFDKTLYYQKIKEASEKQGVLNMVEDGFIKATNGITTIEEILRVTKE